MLFRLRNESYKLTVLDKYYVLLVVLVFSISGKQVNAQIDVNFGVNADSGCVPFNVRFIDSSSAFVTYRHWDFGNGNVAIGNNITPSAIYNSSGVYDVTLTVSDGVDTASITKTGIVSVFSNPSVSFGHQAQLTGCASFPFSVTNTSPSGIIPIANWEWDFDDGSPLKSGQNINHLYRNAGVFNVTLIVTDSLGCSNSLVKPSLVNVKPKPVADFVSNDSLSVCGPPLTINIFNTSTSSHPLFFNWTVGGVNYTTSNVSPTFTAAGGYDAELIVTSTIGCSDTLLVPNYVWIGNIIASMNIPDTACLGELKKFENTSQGGHLFYWDFGDGDTAIGADVFHAYSNPGIHTVTLVSSGGANCDDTITQDIFIESVEANFSSTPHYGCEVPFGVVFTDLSVGNGLSWEWRFGNLIGSFPFLLPNISNSQNPSNTYLDPGTYDDTLIVTSVNGCKDTMIVVQNEEIIVTNPSWFAVPIKGCFPLDVSFNNQSAPMARVANWWWEFDDGSPLDYSLNPTHTFQNVGEYTVVLTIVSIDGCTASFDNEILVGSKQSANFAINTAVACASDTVIFENLSQDTNLITSYNWSFGDGMFDGDEEPTHLYLDTGYMQVSLVASYNGCLDTLVVDSAIYINGPLVNIMPIYNCDSQNVVQFNSSSLGGTNFSWSFGDSTAKDSINWSPVHHYPVADGNYPVKFIVWDSISGCSQTRTQNVAIRYIDGAIAAVDTTLCKGDLAVFDVGKTLNGVPVAEWSIDGFGNQFFDKTKIIVPVNDLGPHTIYSIVRDFNGCRDTVSQNYYVYEPVANYILSDTIGCAPLSIQFSDASTSDTSVVNWLWDFGGGNFSTLQNPNISFNGDGTTDYDISLTVTDTFGCFHQIYNVNAITVVEPPSFFTSTDIEVCEDSPVSFSNIPTGNYSYLWNFDDGTTSVLQNPVHEYVAHGVYDVSLTVIDSLGCDSTYVERNFIEVQDTPIADFSATAFSSDCFPASIVFTDLSTYTNLDYWSWNFGDSPNFAVQYSPGAQNFYNAPGFYDVTVVVTTTFGCSDTITKSNFIHIGGPTGNISHEPGIGCLNQEILFDIENKNLDAQKVIWDFGDGVVETSFGPNLMMGHAYTVAGNYNVSAIISDIQGFCQITDTLSVEVDEINADFIISDTSGCTPVVLYVNNNSSGEDVINWFLDGDPQGQNQLDSFLIVESGMHVLTLQVKNNYSQCLDTMNVNVEVFPDPILQLSQDVTICAGDSVQLNVTGADTFSWWPVDYLSQSNIYNPLSIPDSSITYRVEAWDINECYALDSITITVQQEVVLDAIRNDTTIFVGTELFLFTESTGDIWYNWSPPFAMGCTDCPSPLVQPSESITYQLTYGDLNGCFQFDTAVKVEVLDEFKVSIPNTFTPGSDNLNDTFVPVVYGVEEMVYMRIYDRWGGLVFESKDITIGWDGTYKNKLVAHNSAYSYTTRFRRYNGEIKDYVGFVLVVINGQ